MREAVYQRARAALARQLTAVDPPLTSREIETQHQELEDAVVRLEAEFAPPEPMARRYEPEKDEFSFTPDPQPEPAPMSVPMPVAAPSRRQPPPMHPGMDEGVADFDADDDEDEDYDDDDERGSRLPALIGLLVVILVIAGIGGYAYSQRDAVFGLLGFGSGSQQAETVPQANTPPQAAGGDDSNKQPDRLTNGTEPPPAPAALPETAMSGPVETGEMAPAPDMTTAPDTMGQSDQQMASVDSQAGSGTDLVAQRAIYYYQGAEGEQGEAYNGTATWANVEKDGRPAIHATLSIPDRNVQASISIYKNYDNTLPASHLVEIEFKGNLSGNPIERVPALVLKQTEQARGQPLAGAAVPVTNNLFWIALSDDPDQVGRNLQLLREGSWFDIPILFNDQTRALLTFEKGIPGDKVFQAVMASWTP